MNISKIDRDIIPSTVENLNKHAIHKLRECSWNTWFGVKTLFNCDPNLALYHPDLATFRQCW